MFNVIQTPGPGGRNYWDGHADNGVYYPPDERMSYEAYFPILSGLANKTITISVQYDGSTVSQVYIYDANKTRIGGAHSLNQTDSETGRKYAVIEVPSDAVYISWTNTNAIYYIQLEEGSIAHPYEPYLQYKFFGDIAVPSRYQPATSADTTNFPQILTGLGTKVLKGTESWSVATTNVLQADILTNNAPGELCISSHLTYSTSNTFSGMPDGSFKNGSSTYTTRMYVKSSTLATDATTWNAYISAQYANGTPVTVLYPLATSDGSIWDFVKDTQDNVFGYLKRNDPLQTFVKAFGATGTLGETVYDHFMLKGGNT